MTQDFDIDLDDIPAPKKPKATKPVVIDSPALDEAGLTDVLSAREAVEPNKSGNERDLINQLLGQAQAAKAISQFSRTIGISKLAYVKESKIYKALKGMSPNGTELSGTWAEFCALLDMSVDKADLDIANLKEFGEEALESMTRMGIGYRDLAQYRKLPEDQKTALIEAAKSGDKDQLLDLAETLIERHVSEKAELNSKVANLEADLTQAGKRANNMDAEIERLTITNERLVNKQRLTSFEPLTEDVRLECMHLQATIEVNFASLNKLFESVFFAEQSSDEQKLRVEQVYIAMQSALAAGVSWLNSIHEIYDEELAPKRIQAQHVLTPPEAERWLLEFESLKNAHNAAEAARQIARDKDKPRGRGRPAGSTNKGE